MTSFWCAAQVSRVPLQSDFLLGEDFHPEFDRSDRGLKLVRDGSEKFTLLLVLSHLAKEFEKKYDEGAQDDEEAQGAEDKAGAT